jgi:hypothetical protein
MQSTARSHTISVRAFVLAAVLGAPTVCLAINSVHPAHAVRTERYFQSIRKNYNQLLLFLHAMLKGGTCITGVTQFLAVCSRSKWSRHLTKSPFLALLATAGSNAVYKIISACSNAVN